MPLFPPGQFKDLKLVYAASPAALRNKQRLIWMGVRIMCHGTVTCLPVTVTL